MKHRRQVNIGEVFWI